MNDDGILWELLWSLISEHLGEFSISPGRKHVVTKGEGVGWVSIGSVDGDFLRLENGKSESVFLLGSV